MSLIGLGIILIATLICDTVDWRGTILFAVLAGVSVAFSVELYASAHGSRISVFSVLIIAALLSLGVAAGLWTALAAGITAPLTEAFKSRNTTGKSRSPLLFQILFNSGMFIIAAFLAGVTYLALGGTTGQILSVRNIIPLAGAVTVDQLVNIFLLIGVLSLQSGQSLQKLWSVNFRWGLPMVLLSGVVGGGCLAVAYTQFGPLGLAFFMLPVLLINYSYRLYIHNTKTYVNEIEMANRRLDEANTGLLATLGAVIDAYDIYTYGHSTQVARYAKELAREIGLDHKAQDLIFRAGLVHDLGKIGINETLLSKQGPLTKGEYEIIKRHSDIGADIIGQMTGYEDIVSLVRHHHERWDGAGYPAGLKGEEIPIGARVLCLADSLDTMCSDRPFRQTMSFDEVKAEVRRCTGTQFAPEVAAAFERLVDKNGSEFFPNSAAQVDRSIHSDGRRRLHENIRYLKRSLVWPEKEDTPHTVDEVA